MPDENGRSQDQGRRHRKAGRPSAETSTLLARYQAAMRDDLSAILDELEPTLPDSGLGLVAEPPKRLALKDRAARWDLGIKLARELATEIDPGGDPGALPPVRRRRAAKVDFGGT